MNRQSIKSRTGAVAAGHEGDVLEVEFGNGDVWRYQPVGAAVYAGMTAAGGSFGKMLHTIKNDPDVTATKVTAPD
jgi:KTSC domain